ncbi:unnamed protein product [Microthlaspi erraticum]|uniref:FLZ-type domain-containing protein n=1 Tax=Microthlaspi erraticum TaxID=1685480 RepID=A0A6D2IR78_9BRAS|nr:unnamed protein product [Microthlaspi erraticum]
MFNGLYGDSGQLAINTASGCQNPNLNTPKITKATAMTDLIVPSKRPRVPSIADKHHEYSETHAAASSSGTLPENDMSQAQIKNFLEICRFCKKKLCHGEDIYMYG